MQIYKFETSITSVGGTVSVNTLDIIGGLCHQVYVKAASSGTTFQTTITDDASRVVRNYDYHTDFILDEAPLIMQGVYTVQIVNGSHDQDYEILLMLREQ